MATKKKQDVLKECDTQRDSLYASFGRLLYENVQSGGISYFFEPENPALAAQAKRLVRDVVVGKIADRKPKLDPFVIARRKALKDKAQAAPVVPAKIVKPASKPVKPAPAVPVVKAPAKPVKVVKVVPKPAKPKNEMMAVIKGVQNMIAAALPSAQVVPADRKSTRLNSSH